MLLHLWRNFRWWLFSKNELGWLIRSLQGQTIYLHQENARLRAEIRFLSKQLVEQHKALLPDGDKQE